MTDLSFLVLHGPNLNMLGAREPLIYGSLTLDQINERLTAYAQSCDVALRIMQSNHEGVMVDAIQEARNWSQGIVINAAAYTHTSLALHDAIIACGVPTVEVHISNVAAREEFRHHSMIARACVGSIVGLGWLGYQLALEALIARHAEK
jgi:3-dehydroquinate dehydratase-2